MKGKMQVGDCLNPYCNGRKNRIRNVNYCRFYPQCLNPYCNGRKNRILVALHHSNQNKQGLNPYCNGRKNRILARDCYITTIEKVLILIVMEERIGYLNVSHESKLILLS